MNKKHKIFDVGKMWGKKTEKPSQSAFCKGFVYPEPGLNCQNIVNSFRKDLIYNYLYINTIN